MAHFGRQGEGTGDECAQEVGARGEASGGEVSRRNVPNGEAGAGSSPPTARRQQDGEDEAPGRARPVPRTVEELAACVRTLAPSCGPVRLVGIDGYAGSGKSTFARELAERLGGAPVVHLDDLSSHAALFDWTERLTSQVLQPLARGETARYEVYDWVRRRFVAGGEVPPESVVLVEGVGAGRRAVYPWLALLLWLECAQEQAWRRGRERDGAAQAEFWDGWERAERAHFVADASRPRAQALVFPGPHGHRLQPGPAGWR